MGRQLLILLLGDATEAELETAVEAHGDGYPSVYVVAPAHVKALEWLATDEARAHGEAGARALEAEWLLAGSAEIGGGEPGSSDPVQAVADALERFPADEIVVVGSGEIDPHLLPALAELGPPGELERHHRPSRELADPDPGGDERAFVRAQREHALGRLRRREPRAAPDRGRDRRRRDADRLACDVLLDSRARRGASGGTR